MKNTPYSAFLQKIGQPIQLVFLDKVFNSNKDIRVRIDQMRDEDVARLIKHLFELCQYEHIDIRKEFDKFNFSNI